MDNKFTSNDLLDALRLRGVPADAAEISVFSGREGRNRFLMSAIFIDQATGSRRHYSIDVSDTVTRDDLTNIAHDLRLIYDRTRPDKPAITL